MAVKKKAKLTYKEMMSTIQSLAMEIGQMKQHVYTADMLTDDYITFKEDTESFKEYLKEKYEKKEEELQDDANHEKAEDK
tara:strand:+ start:1451 stop:1690 length:240 start_codon:yes stop_codon:yes gene_type:complete